MQHNLEADDAWTQYLLVLLEAMAVLTSNNNA